MADAQADPLVVFARSVYRELRRGGHSRAEVVRFLSALVDEIGSDGEPESADERAPAICPDTGLPGAELGLRMVDYEIRRVKEGRQPAFLLVCLEVQFERNVLPGEVLLAHRRLTSVLRHQSRDGDALARLDPERYLLLLPNAEPSVVSVLAERAATALDGIRRMGDDRGLPTGTVVLARAAACTEEVESAAELLLMCETAAAVRFYGA